MKYKGIELKEITTPQIIDPPREMLVWSDEMVKMNDKEPYKETVYAVVKLGTHYVAITSSYQWDYCAEIPEETKPRRATIRELSKWLAQGNGEYKTGTGLILTYFSYDCSWQIGEPVDSHYMVRKWCDTDWHEPTVDYMGIEDLKSCRKMLYFTEPDFFKENEVKIGNQIWMNKNLDISDGCGDIYFNKENGEYYYTWEAAMRIVDKIPGWHLPSRKEWNELVKTTRNDAANLKTKSWKGTDKYGFSAVPAGFWYNEYFLDVGSGASFWSSDDYERNYAWSRYIDTETRVLDYYYNKCYGFSVRLVKDN